MQESERRVELENRLGIHVVDFSRDMLPSEVSIVPFSQLGATIAPGLHRCIGFFQSKYESTDGKPTFGGLVVAVPKYEEPEDWPGHAQICDLVGFRNFEGVPTAWGGFLEVKNGSISGKWTMGFSAKLQDPRIDRDTDESFKQAFGIALQISELIGVCLFGR